MNKDANATKKKIEELSASKKSFFGKSAKWVKGWEPYT